MEFNANDGSEHFTRNLAFKLAFADIVKVHPQYNFSFFIPAEVMESSSQSA